MEYHSPSSSSVASGATGCHLMWLAGLVIAATLVVSTPGASHAQVNDDCLLATGIAALPFVDVINTAAATSAWWAGFESH